MDFALDQRLADARASLRRGALDEAAQRYGDILRHAPGNTDALFFLAQVCCRQDRIADGIALLRRALAIDPRQPRALVLLGLALSRCDRPDEALSYFDAALALDPALVDAHGPRADMLAALGRAAEAIAGYDRALALDPDSFANWTNRGAALYELRRFADAAASFARAAALEPADPQSHFNRGNALAGLGRHGDALAAFDAALALQPQHRDALFNRGCLLSRLERYDTAATAFEQVLALAPDHPSAAGELVHCRLMACDWPRLNGDAQRLDAALTDEHSLVPPFTLLGLDVDPARLLASNARYVAYETRTVTPLPPRRPAGARERLRIAYLGDFNRHPVSYLTAALFEHHDRTRFDITGMALGADDASDIRARIAGAFDRFIDGATLTDAEAARQLRDLDIDIAVDLVGHTENARPGLLAHRPAPVQASWLGYLATLGAGTIDYVIGDRVVLPFDRQPFYAEAIVQLPECFVVQERAGTPATPAMTRANAGLPAQGFVFCSFNHSYKIRPAVFAVWMQVLRALPDSVLWLLGANDQAVANLRREAAQRAVDPARLIFAGRVGLAAHVARQRLADLFLDTMPYNAGATAGATLAAGVPLLTCRGESMVGRMAASMLTAAGLPELIATDLADYAERATALARDPASLAALRQRLARAHADAPLFDPARFARHIEAAYGTMALRWQRGQPPAPFAVAPVA